MDEVDEMDGMDGMDGVDGVKCCRWAPFHDVKCSGSAFGEAYFIDPSTGSG